MTSRFVALHPRGIQELCRIMEGSAAVDGRQVFLGRRFCHTLWGSIYTMNPPEMEAGVRRGIVNNCILTLDIEPLLNHPPPFLIYFIFNQLQLICVAPQRGTTRARNIPRSGDFSAEVPRFLARVQQKWSHPCHQCSPVNAPQDHEYCGQCIVFSFFFILHLFQHL